MALDEHQSPPRSERQSRLKNRILEEGPGFRRALADLPNHLNGFTVSTGIAPAVVILLTFAALQVELLTQAGIATDAIVAWVSVSWGLGGVIAVVLSLYYKMPIAGAWSIPGFILVASTLESVSLSEAFGGFWIAGLLVLVLGLTGAIRWLVTLLPVPVILGMIAGILVQFPVDMVSSFQGSAAVIGAGIVGYVIFDKLGGLLRRVPGILGTFLFGGAAAGLAGQLDFSGFRFSLGQVSLTAPEFSLVSVFSIAIPLALLVVGAENMQATGILASADYKPPVGSMTVASGLGGMLTALLGGHNANIAGPTTAVVSSSDAGATEGRYVAGAISGVTYIGLAFIGGTVVALLGSIPASLSVVLLGMVLVKPVISTIQQAWSAGSFAFGAFFAFFIALSDITFLGISAPFWALVGGVAASLIFEFGDYRELLKGDAESVTRDDSTSEDSSTNSEKSPEKTLS